MLPWLPDFELPLLGTVSISSYFLFVMLGCVAASEVTIREARRSNEDPRKILQILVPAILAGFVGARLFHFLFVPRAASLLDDPLVFFKVNQGGLVFYGAVAGGLLAAILGARRQGLGFLRLADILAAPLVLGLAIGRMGCLANGCCYGRPIDWPTGIEWPWGILFLAPRVQVPEPLRGIALHPTQAYAVLSATALFLLVAWIRRRQRFDGEAVGLLSLGYGLTRCLLELFRFDTSRGFWFEEQLGPLLSTSQGLSLPLILLGAALLWRGHRAQAGGGSSVDPPTASPSGLSAPS